ncbi:MAG: HEAT repeat domain-containing protein [Planctomycetes bacterium]|nr:HEAT repeat domain-containing protein [Planctomycetota bacterium]
MNTQNMTRSAVTAGAPQGDGAALDGAFEALKTYDWGADRAPLKPLDDAVVVALGDAAARKALEARLAAVLETGVSRDAKDVVCRKLRILGTADSVPTLAGLLPDWDLSHMARYALERIQDPAAGAALRDALPKLSGALKAGVAGSLGARCDAQAVPALIGLLRVVDALVVAAAATALGAIGTPEAATALADAAGTVPAGVKAAVIDGAFRAAERLAAAGKKAEAEAVYKTLMSDDMPEHVKLAATRGLRGG